MDFFENTPPTLEMQISVDTGTEVVTIQNKTGFSP
jgi:hypothetical protein